MAEGQTLMHIYSFKTKLKDTEKIKTLIESNKLSQG